MNQASLFEGGVTDTSRAAYANHFLPMVSGLKRKIVSAFSYNWDRTNRELQEQTGIAINSITSTVVSLRDEAILVKSCERKCNVTGNNVAAWRLNTGNEPARQRTTSAEKAYLKALNDVKSKLAKNPSLWKHQNIIDEQLHQLAIEMKVT